MLAPLDQLALDGFPVTVEQHMELLFGEVFNGCEYVKAVFFADCGELLDAPAEVHFAVDC